MEEENSKVNLIYSQDPEPVEPWSSVLDATQPTPLCPQLPYMDLISWNWNDIVGDEDCLLLNVFSPKVHFDAHER